MIFTREKRVVFISMLLTLVVILINDKVCLGSLSVTIMCILQDF